MTTLHFSSSSMVCGVLLTFLLSAYLLAGVHSQPAILETECPRIRKAWHLLSASEKQLVKEGFLDLRNSAHPALDKLVTVAGVHADPFYTGLVHVSSANYFWHGYLVWEIETQVRALDAAKYACWAMPYYDYTVDYGREAHASILTDLTSTSTTTTSTSTSTTTGTESESESESESETGTETTETVIESGYFGGYGDPDDFYAVNDYSWAHVSPEDWYVPGTDPACCQASHDAYPYCSVKRRQPDVEDQGNYMPSAAEMSPLFNDADFAHFADYMYSYPLDGVIKFLSYDDEYASADGDVHGAALPCLCTTICGSSEGYDPIWWLVHSFAQYHLSLWINCANNGYTTAEALTDGVTNTKNKNAKNNQHEIINDGSNVGGLGGGAYQVWFNEAEVLDKIADRRVIDPTLDMNDYQFGLDDLLYFPGISDEPWSYTHSHALTVRQLYDISAWNVQYDVGTFYHEAGVDEFCDASKLNSEWFVGLNENKKKEKKEKKEEKKKNSNSSFFGGISSSSSSSLYLNFMMILVFAGVSIIALGVYYAVRRCRHRNSKRIDGNPNRRSSLYGTVGYGSTAATAAALPL